jgi:VanZ family protein
MPDSARHGLKNAKLWQAALVSYWGALFVGTHIPSHTPLAPGAVVDKVVHLGAYAGLAALLAITWQLSAGRLTTRHLVWLWLAILCFAAVDEWTQIPVGRDGNLWDWLADATGAFFALSLFAWWRQSGSWPPSVK